MSTITSYDDALDFMPRRTKGAKRRSLALTLRNIAAGLREGLAAERRYYELTARGVPHARAVEQVFVNHYAAL